MCAGRLRLAVLLACVAAALLAAPAHGQSAAVQADRYDVDIAVQDDGTLAVVERLALDFVGGPYRHGFSTVSLERVEDIRDVRVGEPGRPYDLGRESPYTYTTRRDGSYLRIDWWFPPTSNTRREFEIRYDALGALRIYPGGDQLDWQAIDADRGYAVREAAVDVTLPADIPADKLKTAAYPERQRVAIQQVDPRHVRFQTSDLANGAGLVVRVQFPHGIVAAQPPRWQAEADREDWAEQTLRPALNFLLLLLGLLIPVVGLVGLGILWAARGRDPTVQRGAAVLSEPPSDLPAPLVGTLVDGQADAQDVIAALVDLGNRGVIRIAEVEGPNLVGSSHDYEIERLTTDDAGLRDYERTLLVMLLGEGKQVRLSQVRQTFAAGIPTIQAALHEEVARAGLFHENPAAVRQRYQHFGILVMGLAVVGAIFAGGWLARYSDLALLPFAGLFVVGLAAFALAGRMAGRTRAGVLAANRWLAFRRHLAEVAAGRSDAQQEEFQRYLPYAIALGLAQSWLARFTSVGAPAPAWYAPSGTFIPTGPIIIGDPGWGYGHSPYGYSPYGTSGGGSSGGPGLPHDGGSMAGPPTGDYGAGGLQGMSDSLSNMLGRASDVFASGGDSGWSGGGFGDFGGSSGASGGGSSGFDGGGGGFDGGGGGDSGGGGGGGD